MSTITSVKLWYDPGYTEGACEIPPVGHTLGTPDVVINGPINPSKGRLFEELQVKEAYTDLMNCSYLEVSISFNNGEASKTFFGWVDSITLSSDTDDYPMTVVKWHIDLWRTYNASAEYGSGFVARRPSTTMDLWQNFPYRRMERSSKMAIFPVKKDVDNVKAVMWAVIAYNYTGGSSTLNRVITYPVRTDAGIGLQYNGSIKIDFPSFNNTFNGEWDEFFELDPKDITGCWLSPMAPFEGPSDASFDVYDADGSLVPVFGFAAFENYAEPMIMKDPGTTYKHGAFLIKQRNMTQSKALTSTLTSTETERLVVNGCFNEVISEIPFGWSLSSVQFTVKLSPIDAMIEMRIEASDGSSGVNGLVFDIPLPSLDLNENAWSSYVYSGEREYNRAMRSVNADKSMVEGTIGGIGNGALMGGMLKGDLTGAGIGAVVGSILGFIPGFLDQTVFNDRFMEIEDRYHASMANGIITSGFAHAMYFLFQGINVNLMHMDAESAAMVTDIRTVQGVKYGAPTQDCTSLIAAGGPMQITNLIVKGDIPVEAKKWIREKFADGVRIIARS